MQYLFGIAWDHTPINKKSQTKSKESLIIVIFPDKEKVV
jgi:hypothetical protein